MARRTRYLVLQSDGEGGFSLGTIENLTELQKDQVDYLKLCVVSTRARGVTDAVVKATYPSARAARDAAETLKPKVHVLTGRGLTAKYQDLKELMAGDGEQLDTPGEE